MRFSYYIHHYRDYTRPDLPSGGEGEVSGSSNVPDLSAALAGILVGASTPYHLMLSHCICGTQNEKSPIVAFHVHGFCLPDQAKLPGPRELLVVLSSEITQLFLPWPCAYNCFR